MILGGLLMLRKLELNMNSLAGWKFRVKGHECLRPQIPAELLGSTMPRYQAYFWQIHQLIPYWAGMSVFHCLIIDTYVYGILGRSPHRPMWGRRQWGHCPPPWMKISVTTHGLDKYWWFHDFLPGAKLLSCSHCQELCQKASWLAAQEWTTNKKPGQQVDTSLDMTTTHKFPPQVF